MHFLHMIHMTQTKGTKLHRAFIRLPVTVDHRHHVPFGRWWIAVGAIGSDGPLAVFPAVAERKPGRGRPETSWVVATQIFPDFHHENWENDPG